MDLEGLTARRCSAAGSIKLARKANHGVLSSERFLNAMRYESAAIKIFRKDR
ncbi:hypothetical protein [Paralcaligenes ginsengisoli]